LAPEYSFWWVKGRLYAFQIWSADTLWQVPTTYLQTETIGYGSSRNRETHARVVSDTLASCFVSLVKYEDKMDGETGE